MAKYIQRQGGYHYFRYPGAPRQRLRGAEGSPEYVKHYQELLMLAEMPGVVQFPNARRSVGRPLNVQNQPSPVSDLRKVFLPGSLGWAVEKFVTNGPAFLNRYKPGTREGHRLCLDLVRFGDHKNKADPKDKIEGLGAGMLADLDRKTVRHFCAMVAEKRGTARADQARRCLSLLWQFACTHLQQIKIDDERPNPARGIGAFHEIQRPHARWPEHVQRQFLDGAPDHLRLGFFLARYTGFRRGDICHVTWSQYDEQEQTIYIETEKTGEYVPMHVVPELAKLLAKTERRSETILTDEKGQPVSKDTLSKWVRQRLREMNVHGLTLHGLRKTLACWLAERGATVQQIMFVLGHKTAKMALYYCSEANKQSVIRDAFQVRRQPQKIRRVK